MFTPASLRSGAVALALALCGGLAIAFAVALVTAPLTPRLDLVQAAFAPAGPDTLPEGSDATSGDGAA